LFSCNSSAQDIGLHSKYSLSLQPNYSLSAPSNDSTALTDGNYSSSLFKFWKQQSTVGWQTVNPIKICIDLGKIGSIGAIGFNTVRSLREGVYFPTNIFVFTSSDKNQLFYAGDAASDSENQPGSYKIKKFMLNIKAKARYLYIVVVPKGNLIFCDEIEVIGEKDILPLKREKTVHLEFDRLDKVVDSLKNAYGQELLTRININRFKNMLAKDRDSSSIAEQLNSLDEKNGVKTNDALLKLFASFLRKTFAGDLLVRSVNSWDSLHPIFRPPEKIESNRIVTVVNGSQYIGFTITNLRNTTLEISCFLQPAQSPSANAKLFYSPFIRDNNLLQSPDQLIPIDSKGMKLRAGETQLIFLEITGRMRGKCVATFNVKGGKSLEKVPVNITVSPIALPEFKLALNAIDWGYLYFKLINDRQSEAIKDQLKHHINTIVIPPWLIPKIGQLDFHELKSYLSLYNGAANILLFVNYADKKNLQPKGVGDFMSPTWKKAYIDWYQHIETAVIESGFESGNLYLYPFDEVKGDDISIFKSFASWVKANVPSLKLYATLDNMDAIQQLMPMVDVAQVKDDPVLLNNLPTHHNQVWIYSLFKFAKSASPYTAYRLMAWRAFANGLTGIGFWSYADVGKAALNFDVPLQNLDAREDDYSVVYRGFGKTIISSRRWEAFKLGIEDYQLLMFYAKKKGVVEAKKLASIVVDNPNNFAYADSIRNRIINILSK
jgi:hypothetical protein